MHLDIDKTQTVNRIDKIIFYSLLGLVFIMPFSLGLLNTFLYSIAVLQLIKSILTRQLFPEIKYLKILFFAILGIVLVSLYNAPHEFLHMSFKGVKKICVYMIFSLAIINSIDTKEKIQKIFFFLSMGLIIISIDTLFQYAFGFDLIRLSPLYSEASATGFNIMRATALYPNPNDLGIYLSTFFFVLTTLSFHYKELPKKNLWKAATLLCALGVFFTFSRGAGLAISTICILTLILLKNKQFLIFLVGVFMISLIFLPQDITSFIKKINSPTSLLYGTAVKDQNRHLTVTDRRDLWTTALNMAKAHPFIGVGFYTFSDQYVTYRNVNDPNYNIRAHSGYFEILAELGVTGFVLFILLMFYALFYSFQNYRKINDSFLKLTSISLFFALSSFMVNSTYDSTMRSARLVPFFWLLLGLIFSYSNFSKDKSKYFGH